MTSSREGALTSTVDLEVGCGGLYVNPATCWQSKAESFSAISLLLEFPNHEQIVRALSESLLLAVTVPDRATDAYWVKRYEMAARVLINPDYAGRDFVTDEVRSGLLIFVAVAG